MADVPQPTHRPTGAGRVFAAGAVGAAGGWLLAQGLLASGASLPVLGASAWLPMLLLAAVTGWLAWATHRAVRRRPPTLDARTAVTRLLIGKTSLLAGAALAGGYLALALAALPGWPAPLAQGRLLHGGIAVATGVLWAGAGRLLEGACRIPDEPADRPDRAGPDNGADGSKG